MIIYHGGWGHIEQDKILRIVPLTNDRSFDRIGVDVLRLPKTKHGNKYTVVVVDYLTKWQEVYGISHQTAWITAKLFVEQPSCGT